MSSWIPQTYSNEAEAVVSLVNALVRASYTYLSLSLFFDLHNVAPEGLGHCFFPPQNGGGAARGSHVSLQVQISAILLKPSQDEWGETQHTVEVPCSENNLKHPYPYLCDCRESHALEEQVKLTKKMATS
ncbi:hypothetical protein Celaphus_00000507 [Cervus elaphus hippelaphus]|uniref:Ferritin light chain n=1 Tax=Cervus elaphus hippelaphus TaxID=46360 RepID=A0A212D7J6_CEREH|nr:hypothetical protein Celaphus_00000507 [Cervus elaphus hippelaphus]